MNRHSSSDSENTPIVMFKSSNKKQLLEYNNRYSQRANDLYTYRQEKCEFCEELLFCSYDLLVHNAKHIIIPLKDELQQCSQCNIPFANPMDLDIHTKIQHFEVPNILQSLVLSRPVVECDSSLTELVIQNNEKKLEKILFKNAVVECDNSVTELIEEKKIENNEKKLEKILFKKAVVECDNSITELIEDKKIENNDKKLEKILFKKAVVECDNSITELIEEKKIENNEKKLEKILFKKAVVECDNAVTELIEEKKIENNEKKLEKILFKKAVVECDSAITQLIEEKKIEKLKEFVTKQPVIRCEDTINTMLAEKSEYDNDKMKTDKVENSTKDILDKEVFIRSDDKDFKEKEVVKDGLLLPKSNTEFKSDTSNLKNRLIFEDDDIDFEDDIISTNVNNIREKIMVVWDLTNDSSDDEFKANEEKENNACKETKPEENFSPAVHYEDLILPKQLKCGRCGLTFKNRYELITHETKSHLNIKKGSIARCTRVCSLCDKYIAGNHWILKRHMEKKHQIEGGKHQASYTLKNCEKCNLKYYVYLKHCKNYHFIYKCKICSKAFETELLLSDHIQTCTSTFGSIPQVVESRIGMEKIIKVCELCSMFFRNTSILKYVHLRDYSEKGKRITCERCEKKFFDVKLIKLINKHTIVQPFYEYPKKNMSHSKSNEKRLKKIQKRLKLMKRKCS